MKENVFPCCTDSDCGPHMIVVNITKERGAIRYEKYSLYEYINMKDPLKNDESVETLRDPTWWIIAPSID